MNSVIASCAGANGQISYVGRATAAVNDPGELAMIFGSQHVAPMSRQLHNIPQENGGDLVACTASSKQLLIGLEGISVVAKNATHGDPAACTDDIGGVSSPLVMTGIPSQFIPCTSSATCTALFGGAATCDTLRQFCQVSGTPSEAALPPEVAHPTGPTRSTTEPSMVPTTGRTSSARSTAA